MINQRRVLTRTLLSAVVGLFAGVSSTVFLTLLEWATGYRLGHLSIIWLLPVAGLLIGILYHHFGQDSARGNNLIIDEIHDPKKILPLRMAPLVLLSTVVTHLFGGSSGREGTAVQMGASLADQLTRWLKNSAEERKILLVAGAGAGFGAAIGTPFAGMIFGMEVLRVGRLRFFAGFECLIASFVAYGVSILCGAPHSHYPPLHSPEFHLTHLFWVAVFGILMGFTAIAFVHFTHLVEKFQKMISYPPLRPFVGGVILVALYRLEGTYRFAGLGIEHIQFALKNHVGLEMPLFKTLFTGLTLGSGFKGGEFVPLVFIGTTFGSFLAAIIPVSRELLASVGFAALFAGASNTPIACSIMAIEIFGWPIAPYATIACLMSYYCSGRRGIYEAQRRS